MDVAFESLLRVHFRLVGGDVIELTVLRFGAERPLLVAAEPDSAACLLESAAAGRAVALPGPLDTIMAGLRCGEPSAAAWPAALPSGKSENSRRGTPTCSTRAKTIGTSGARWHSAATARAPEGGVKSPATIEECFYSVITARKIAETFNMVVVVLTDSGGFQIFSLPESRSMREEGAEFKSYVDNTLVTLSPERSIARRVAVNSPAYLIWSPEDDSAAAQIPSLCTPLIDTIPTCMARWFQLPPALETIDLVFRKLNTTITNRSIWCHGRSPTAVCV